MRRPLLIGFSGGPDSLALAHYLKNLGIVIELAHFDHGWREESEAEAKQLKKWAQGEGLVIHLGHGNPLEKSELEARSMRFAFFKTLFLKGNYEALVLAHHEQDRAETILKRVFEGAGLQNLKGMAEETVYERMPIWRPFLKTPKKEILTYLKKQGLNPLDDPSNRDSKYLRVKMRENLMPELSKIFGKEIVPSLIRLGEYAEELGNYLQERVKKFPSLVGPFGLMWDFSEAHPLEVRAVLSAQFLGEISAKIFEQIFKALDQGLANHRIVFTNQKLIIDRKRIFWLKKNIPIFSQTLKLQKMIIDPWHIQINKEGAISSSWKSWWQGKVSIALPQGDYELIPADGTFRKEWNNQKIPAFLRDSLPLICRDGKVFRDFFIQQSTNLDDNLLVTIDVKSENMVS